MQYRIHSKIVMLQYNEKDFDELNNAFSKLFIITIESGSYHQFI